MSRTSSRERGYRAFDLVVRSEIDLPELPQISATDGPDIEISLGAVDWTANADDRFVYDAPDRYRLLFPIGGFAIEGGRTITVDVRDDVPNEILRHALLGPALNHLLAQRGLFVLHASTVAIKDRAVAFLGPSGAGKTTMAMGMYRAGYPIVSDDVAAIELRDGDPVVKPGFPSLKLDERLVERYDIDVAQPTRICEQRDYHFYGLRRHAADSLPLRRAYLLATGDSERIAELPADEAFALLLEHAYANRVALQPVEGKRQFALARQVSEAISVRRLERRFDLEALEDVVQLVVDDATA